MRFAIYHFQSFYNISFKQHFFMMRFFLSIIWIALLCAALQIFLAWWICAVVSFIVAFLLPQKSSDAFWTSFWALFLLWFGYAFWIDYTTESFLSQKIAQLLFIPSSFLLILLTGFIAGLVSGFAGLAGSYFRKMFSWN